MPCPPRLLFGLLAFAVFAPLLTGQPRGRIPPYLQNPDRLDPAEGQRVLQQFRRVGIAGDFAFAVEFIHEPHREPSQTYTGVVAGRWGEAPQTRIDLDPLAGEDHPRRFLQWNGRSPELWTVDWDAEPPVTEKIEDERLFQPLLPGITFTPYDLQMPFIYWREYAYEGPNRLKGRPVHYFLLYPPEDDPRYAEIGAVRIALDADFNVAVRAETLGVDGTPLKRLDVQSVKKVAEQWIVRRLDLLDLVTEDRTRFHVTGAAVGVNLPDKLLNPESLTTPMDLSVEMTSL